MCRRVPMPSCHVAPIGAAPRVEWCGAAANPGCWAGGLHRRNPPRRQAVEGRHRGQAYLHAWRRTRPARNSVGTWPRNVGGSGSVGGRDGFTTIGADKMIRIGTSGFSYDDWLGTVYPGRPPRARPTGVLRARVLSRRAQRHLLPRPARARSRGGPGRHLTASCFAVKAYRSLTHEREAAGFRRVCGGPTAVDRAGASSAACWRSSPTLSIPCRTIARISSVLLDGFGRSAGGGGVP